MVAQPPAAAEQIPNAMMLIVVPSRTLGIWIKAIKVQIAVVTICGISFSVL